MSECGSEGHAQRTSAIGAKRPDADRARPGHARRSNRTLSCATAGDSQGEAARPRLKLPPRPAKFTAFAVLLEDRRRGDDVHRHLRSAARRLPRASEPMPLGTRCLHLATALIWRDRVGPLPRGGHARTPRWHRAVVRIRRSRRLNVRSTFSPPPFHNVAVVGETLSRYHLVAHLGSGAMGDVYRAEDQRLRRTVALKVVRAARDPEETSRQLLAEARAGSALTHPNIAVVYEVDEVEHHGALLSFIAMEYVAGRTLADLAAQGPLALDTILDVGRQVADALAAAHAYGLVHQDIKPSNVMVTENGLVKVLDFGVARWSAPMIDTAPTQTVDPLAGCSSRHAFVHVAGADHGAATRWTQRYVLPRRRDLRAPGRTSTVRRIERGAGARGAVAERAAAAARASR